MVARVIRARCLDAPALSDSAGLMWLKALNLIPSLHRDPLSTARPPSGSVARKFVSHGKFKKRQNCK